MGSSKIQSLFDADDDDEGMFGGSADDIFAASPPQVNVQKSTLILNRSIAFVSQSTTTVTDTLRITLWCW